MCFPMAKQVKVFRGTKLRCKGWRQEAILRMLEANVETGINPDELITYAGECKLVRNWESYDKTVEILKNLEDDETLLMQSGKPVVVFKTRKGAPVMLHAVCNIVGRWDNPEGYRELERKGLTIYPCHAPTWNRPSVSHGQFQGEYARSKEVADEYFGGTLKSRFHLTSGLGKAARPQAIAAKMLGAVCLIVDANRETVNGSVKDGWVDKEAKNLDEALKMVDEAKKKGTAVTIALCALDNEIYPELVKRGITPDSVTAQSAAKTSQMKAYVPAGMTPEEARKLAEKNWDEFERRYKESVVAVWKAMLEFKDRGAHVYCSENGMRVTARDAGLVRAFEIPNSLTVAREKAGRTGEGRGAFGGQLSYISAVGGRLFFISGDTEDMYKIDNVVLQEFAASKEAMDWMKMIKSLDKVFNPPNKGLPQRLLGYLSSEEMHRVHKIINEMVRTGELKAPVVTSAGLWQTAGPLTMSEGLKDGSDAIADWAFLAAMLSAVLADIAFVAGDAEGIEVTGGGREIVLDGTKEAEEKLDKLHAASVLSTIRLADAGYKSATE